MARPDSVLSEEQVLMEEFDRLIREIGASVVDTSIKPVLLGVVQRLDTALTRVSEVVETGSKNIEALMADTDVAASLRQMAECTVRGNVARLRDALKHHLEAEVLPRLQEHSRTIAGRLGDRFARECLGGWTEEDVDSLGQAVRSYLDTTSVLVSSAPAPAPAPACGG